MLVLVSGTVLLVGSNLLHLVRVDTDDAESLAATTWLAGVLFLDSRSRSTGPDRSSPRCRRRS